MPDGGEKAQEMLDQIRAIEARGWAMAGDGLWYHPEHARIASGVLFEEAVALEDDASSSRPASDQSSQ